MRFLGRTIFWRRLARRVGVVVVLAAYLVAAVGFPVPAAARGDGVPFPCMDHPCGCQSAEQCWRGCCCLTVEERWAWAREHNVEPPPYAERPPTPKKPAPAMSWNTVRQGDQAEGEAPAAHHCADCDRKAAAKPRPCCAKEPAPAPAPASGMTWLGGLGALGCRGHATVWIASGAVTPPPPALVWQPLAPPAGWLSSAPERPLGLSLIPPDPPPRRSHS
jgi:hypothetical protein